MRPAMPNLSPVSLKSDLWQVNQQWISPMFKLKGVKYHLVFFPGYRTDGASIPRLFWRLIGHPLQMPLLICALPHDGLYSGELCTRSEADAVLLDLATRFDISWAKRNAVWTAVRAGGWRVWNKHTAKSVEESRKLCVLVRADRLEEVPTVAPSLARAINPLTPAPGLV